MLFQVRLAARHQYSATKQRSTNNSVNSQTRVDPFHNQDGDRWCSTMNETMKFNDAGFVKLGGIPWSAYLRHATLKSDRKGP